MVRAPCRRPEASASAVRAALPDTEMPITRLPDGANSAAYRPNCRAVSGSVATPAMDSKAISVVSPAWWESPQPVR